MNHRETVSDSQVGRMKTIPHSVRFAFNLPFVSGLARVLNTPAVPDA
ncbi:MAG TPA: hypothetical protein VM510_05115 [Caulifigura sp.]|jgi:hypothetical protein|nr:hypothetical protein [Caulifigura sp.]